jgi:signal transduction histidine kinase
VAYIFDFSILPVRTYSEEQLMINRIINFSTALLASCMGVFLLIRLNNRNSIQLVESNRLLTKTNVELDRFVYSTSHDLRAPLTSILGLINIASLTDDVDAHRRYMGMMKDRINILDKFIKDITDYSRNNRLAIDIKKTQLSVLVTEIWEMLQYTPEAQNVKFQMEIPEDVLVETDVSRLKTVLLNLISNALRYHDQSKQEKFIRLRYQVNGKGFHIKVEDNGQGVDPAYHHRIFDMFFRASESSSGSGLGLYIVKETIAKLSGTIQLESVPGIGTTFTVKLPYA